MAWENTLLDASFRGIVFQVESTDDDIERAVVVHEYPYVDGVDVEDMGRSARPISMCAIFYGPDYEVQMEQFISAIDEAGAGELIHPVFGSRQAQFVRAHISHVADRPDYARVTLEFMEKGLRTPLFDRVLPLQQVDAVNQAADTSLSAAGDLFGLDIGAALSLPSLLRDKLSADMLNVMDNMRTLADQLIDARGWIASGLYYLNNPTAFVDDLTGGLLSRVQAIFSPMDLRLSYAGFSSFGTSASAGISGSSSIASSTSVGTSAGTSITGGSTGVATGYVRGSLATVWKEPLAYLQKPLLTLPGLSSTPTGPFATVATADGTPVQPFLAAHVAVQQSIAIAGAAAAVFAMDLDDPIMTPDDIETIAADTRTSIAATIVLVRQTYPNIVQARPITEPLKALALTVTNAAEKLVRAKPPLIEREVDTPGNLQLLAHLWYGDYRRADELLRLNPQIANPNFIKRSTVLRAYAV